MIIKRCGPTTWHGGQHLQAHEPLRAFVTDDVAPANVRQRKA